MLQIIAEKFTEAISAATRDFPGWLRLWKESNDSSYSKQVEGVKEYITDRLDTLITLMSKQREFQLWGSPAEKKLLEAGGYVIMARSLPEHGNTDHKMIDRKQIHQMKREKWGEDYRGPAFTSAMEIIRARQGM